MICEFFVHNILVTFETEITMINPSNKAQVRESIKRL